MFTPGHRQSLPSPTPGLSISQICFPFTYELLNNSNDLLQAIFYFGSAAILRRKFAVSVSAAATATGGSWSSVAPGDVGGRREQLQHRVGLHVSARYIRVEINLKNKTKISAAVVASSRAVGRNERSIET